MFFRYLDGELLKELPDCVSSSYNTTGYEEDLCDIDPSKLLLENVGRSFQGNYSCEGMNAAGWGPASDEEQLIIYCKKERKKRSLTKFYIQCIVFLLLLYRSSK